MAMMQINCFSFLDKETNGGCSIYSYECGDECKSITEECDGECFTLGGSFLCGVSGCKPDHKYYECIVTSKEYHAIRNVQREK